MREFVIKVLDSSHVMEHACMRRHMDIGQANLYEQVSRQAGLRIQVVIAGACNAEQSNFIHGDVCVSRHVRLE